MSDVWVNDRVDVYETDGWSVGWLVVDGGSGDPEPWVSLRRGAEQRIAYIRNLRVVESPQTNADAALGRALRAACGPLGVEPERVVGVLPELVERYRAALADARRKEKGNG